ncbi:MAG: hypothetical protein ACI9BD_001347 [Candidatus Marinamargulisbacteria bacterium]|jgi:hypothetical protein
MTRIRAVSIFLTLAIMFGFSFLSKKEPVIRVSKYLENVKKVTYQTARTTEESLSTQIDFVSGELQVFPLYSDSLYKFDAFYKVHKVKPLVKFETGVPARLDIRLKKYQKLGLSSRSFWNLGLNRHVSHDIFIQSKASKQTLNFTGIPVERLKVDAGASRIYMYFNEVNPIEMERLYLDLGASDCRIFGLSNSRSKKVDIFGGTGLYSIDFSGRQTASSNVNIHGGVGRAKLIIPPNINARITFEGRVLTSLDIQGFIKSNKNEYLSARFSPQKAILDISIHLVSGTLVVLGN